MSPLNIGAAGSLTKIVTKEDIQAFAAVTGDTNPVHLDEASAAKTRFGGCMAHGLLAVGLISALLGTQLPGSGAICLSQTLTFTAPVYPGDTITARIEVTAIREDKPIGTFRTTCVNQRSQLVLGGEAVLLILAS